MAPDAQMTIRKLMREYRIEFDNQGYSGSWPAPYKSIFVSIKDLGKREFESYHAAIDADSEERPWKAQTKARAYRISELANRCLKTEKNEAGWRLSVESEILARFTIEVNCRNCRARLWRSEIEADTCASTTDRLEQTLQQRRERRIPCSCGPNRKPQDNVEQGLNPLFDDRADEFIQYEEPIAKALGKRQKPDRIYGLKETKKLGRLLSETAAKDGGYIGEKINSSPFRRGSEPLLFPFLILEAKSGKGSDSFSDIEAQSAFSIRALLKLQADLKDATKQDCKWDTEPLVWFFANKGQHWRLSAAYPVQENHATYYRATDLWHGEINKKDDALQLLLLVDYIFDWARDYYRETVIKQLRCLAAQDTPSLAGDSDIYSCAGLVNPWMDELNASIGPELMTQQTLSSIVPEVLKEFDCEVGVIRDARFFQARLYALRISENSLSQVLESANTTAQSQKLARDLQSFLKDAVRVDGTTLDRLETLWTGSDSHGIGLNEPGGTFLAKVSMAAYFTRMWEQVVELTYVALEETAVDALKRHAGMTRGWVLRPSVLPQIGEEKLLSLPRRLRYSSSQRDILLAAITQKCVNIHSVLALVPKKMDSPGGISKLSTAVRRSVLKVSRDNYPQSRRIALSIYNRYKVGMRQPAEEFIRHSLCNCEQVSKKTTWVWQEAGATEPMEHHIPENKNLVCIRTRYYGTSLCMYLLDGPSDYSNLPNRICLRMDPTSEYIASPQGSTRWDYSSNHWNPHTVRPIRNLKEMFKDFFESLRLDRIDINLIKEAMDSVSERQALSTTEDSSRMREQFFQFCLWKEIYRLSQMMFSAGIAVRPTPSAITNEPSSVEDKKHDAGTSISGETSGACSKRFSGDFSPRKRPLDLVSEEEDTTSTSVKRLSIRPAKPSCENDSLDDHEFEALLRDGCFGGSGELDESPAPFS